MYKFISVFMIGLPLVGCQAIKNIKNIEITPIQAQLEPALSIEEIFQQASIRKGLGEYAQAKGNKALAISETGYWSIAEDTNSVQWAAWRALRDCSTKLSVRGRDGDFPTRGCFVYQINDQIFAKPTAEMAEDVMRQTHKLPMYEITLGVTSGMAFDRHVAQDSTHKAFAVSPGGGWGFSHGFTYIDDAADRAIKLCDSSLSFSDSVCSVYALDGEVMQY